MKVAVKQDKLDRRSFLKTTTALGLMAMTPHGLMAAERKAPTRPNILFCFADDWGWPHAGAYGDKVVETPAFDRLAKEGVLFQHAFISSPSCTPSRNAIITGQQFYRLGQGANLHSTLDVKHPNFMLLIRDAGYQIGHWRKAWGPGDWKAGGYEQSPCGPSSTFSDFMKNRDKSKPFCFWFGTSDPHRPYAKGSGRTAGIPVDEIHVPAFFPNNEEIRGDIADYYFEVQRWDNDVKKAIELLEAEGLLDNTIIAMSGDHGMPFPRCKGNLYDWGARVPLAIRWGKKVKPGRTITDFTSLTDLAPTFLEAAGIRAPKEMTGRSLVPTLQSGKEGRVDKERDFVVFGRERHTPAQKMPSMVGYPARAIRTDNWLLILNLEPERWPAGVPEGASHPMDKHADCDNGPTKSVIMSDRESKFYRLCFKRRPAVELYDCEKDPEHVNNLAGKLQYRKTVEELRRWLTEYLEHTGDPRFTDKPVKFDEYPYRTGYMKKRLQKHGYK
jgi:arylsulfatase A-like enzyme